MSGDEAEVEYSVEEALVEQEVEAVRDVLQAMSSLYRDVVTPEQMQAAVDRLDTEEGRREEMQRIFSILDANPALRETFERAAAFQRFRQADKGSDGGSH
jgi:hypothetical protein